MRILKHDVNIGEVVKIVAFAGVSHDNSSLFNVFLFHSLEYNLLWSLTGSSQFSAPFEQPRKKTWKIGLNFLGLFSLLLKWRWKLWWSHEASALVANSNVWLSYIMCIVVISWNHSWLSVLWQVLCWLRRLTWNKKKWKRITATNKHCTNPVPHLSHR